jgi:C1A family cysteine protease
MMEKTWGNLSEEEAAVIQSKARRLTDQEVGERFNTVGEVVKFKIYVKTDRSIAGGLDIDLGEEVDVEEALAGEREMLESEDGEAIDIEMARTEELEEIEEQEVTLISLEDFDYEPELTPEDMEAEKAINEEMEQYAGYFSGEAPDAGETSFGDGEMAVTLPNSVDRRSAQTAVKSQRGRGTCVAHASCGCLEAFTHIPDDLSEQYLHYKFNEYLGRRHDADQGLKTTNAAGYLARQDGRICEEADWTYMLQHEIDQAVRDGVYGPPDDAVNNQDYGITNYKIITDKGTTGDSIKNTRYLEALVYQGYNVVIGTWVSWDDRDNNGVLDPVLDVHGNPVGEAGHAMLVVGYNRSNQYLIVKNSWGGGWGHSGYALLHYDLVRSCFKYGFVVKEPFPRVPKRVPLYLLRAPFSTEKISRSRLRGAIVAFKTSRGKFAIAEVYAGTNLLLKNIKVYNANGTLYTQRPSLVVRGTYLCDIDTIRETRYGADFWWEAVRPGVNYLVPRNGASACILFDFAHVTASDISRNSLYTTPIENKQLDYGVVIGRTTANRRFKMVVDGQNSDNSMRISYLVLYNPDGSRYKYANDIVIPSSWTYNLDTLRKGGTYADIWNHVISDGVSFLEVRRNVRMRLLWHLR